MTSSQSTNPAAPAVDVSSAVALPRLDATRYLLSVLGGTLLVAGLIAAVVAVANQPTWWRGYLAASIAAIASAVVSLTIILPTFKRSVATMMYATLVAGIVRAVVLGVIVVVAIKTGGYPQEATLAIAGLYYFAIVAVESYVLWQMTGGSDAAASVSRPQPLRDRA